jgi:L-histidine N-alpha-methyltransferase
MRPTIEVHLRESDVAESLRRDVRSGLTSTPKSLQPKWFYDSQGSELFEKITALDEYYPMRAEAEILTEHADDIAALTGARTLVELGSGSSEKTRALLSALARARTLREFVPLDVSSSALREAAAAIAREYPSIRVHGVVGDFTRHLERLPGAAPRAVAFLGGTIGNFPPPERTPLLAAVRSMLGEGEWLLLGTDLVKDRATMLAAYDDASGVTARFNRNVLRVLNRELGADFDLDSFEHVAVWNEAEEWIEMRLRATRGMRVRVQSLDLDVDFTDGEEIRTEISAKFRREGITAELRAAGFEPAGWWTDRAGRFAVSAAFIPSYKS